MREVVEGGGGEEEGAPHVVAICEEWRRESQRSAAGDAVTYGCSSVCVRARMRVWVPLRRGVCIRQTERERERERECQGQRVEVRTL